MTPQQCLASILICVFAVVGFSLTVNWCIAQIINFRRIKKVYVKEESE